MNEYEDLPCSVYAPNRVAFQQQQIQQFQSNRENSNFEANQNPSPQVLQQQRPIEEKEQPPRVAVARSIAPTKPEEPPIAKTAPAKKSCLTRNTRNKPIPAHPALKKKTVAFGKTVNVSQTVEGTSRSAKKLLHNSTMDRRDTTMKSPPRAEENGGEQNEEEPEDWRKTMQEELNHMKEEMMEENKKRQNEVMSEMKNAMTEIMKEVLLKNGTSNREDKENMGSYSAFTRTTERERAPPIQVPPSKASIACQIFRREGRLNSDAVEILERRACNNRIFRQQIDDALAEAEYEEKQCLYSPVASSASRYRPDALMKETLTVERSIRLENENAMNAWSVDSRHFMNSAGNSPYTAMNDRGRYQPEVHDVPLHSTYQPGNSISYYPSAVDQQKNRKNNDYYVEHVSDQDDHPEDTSHHHIGESRAEKERRIREKYAKRK